MATYPWQTQWKRHKVIPSSNNGQSSLTEPDLSFTIPEILQRYASGRPIGVKTFTDFSGDFDHLSGLDIRSMDISQVSLLLTELREKVDSVEILQRQKITADKQAAIEASIEAKLEAKYKRRFVDQELPFDDKRGSLDDQGKL